MIRPRRSRAALAAALVVPALVCLPAAPAGAQNAAPPPSTAPSPAQTSPLPTTTAPNPPADPNRSAAPAPEQAVTPPPAGPSAAAPAAPGAPAGAPGRPTLVEKPAEAGDVDEVTLPAKPAAILPGKAKWDDAVSSLKQAFARIEADLAKAGIAPAGRPLAVFTHTDDDGFTYEAMIPVAAAPSPVPAEGDGLRFGTTPSGKALRFAHKGAYESIDGTYETLTTYLDAKDIVVQDRFVEEYASDLKDGNDDGLDVNIYALLR